MLSCMQDSAHDRHHIYRVLYAALDIAAHEANVDTEVLIAACLLHDIGREQQFAHSDVCHAQLGGDMAYAYLLKRQWHPKRAAHVRACISTHRYRGDNPPESIEATILFDADKLDASGAMGIARTLIYGGQVQEPLYVLEEDGSILVDGGGADISSFFQEYNYKLKKVYASLHTERAKVIARERQKTAIAFYQGLYDEVSQNYKNGRHRLGEALDD